MNLKLTILPLCLIVLNAFGFEGTVKQSIANYNGTGANITMTWSIAPRQCRLDVVATGKDISAGNTVLIMDAAAQSFTTYTTGGSGDKTYFRVNTAAITGDVSVSVTKTTEAKKIQGYNAEKWVVITAGGVYDVWVAKDIDFDAASYKDFFKNSVEIQALAQQGVKGFPILTESKSGINTSTVEAISAKTLPSETFSVPSDYKLFVPAQAKAPAKPGK